ncbi:MAG: methylated-DNA--[protein]-cysteine S-methyltransferase [Candidatus Rokubacteria bacterium]|nr:methylated-DNA--[protein]-cysteine S-methyltransferase [Candidatus Rokubacteria bacterium]
MDRVDDLLAAHFGVEPAPAELASRIVRRAGDAEREVMQLLDEIEVCATDVGVCLIRAERVPPPRTAKARRLVERARVELGEYLEGKRTFFTVPVDLSAASPFHREVLAAARSIPFGEVRAYAWIAERIRHPRAVRAVGTALGRNPVPLIVPCHRVLRRDGGVGGYLFGTRVKDRLLALERSTPVLEGCSTTRIVCRVGCVHGRHMRFENRVVFASVTDACSVGYRPCKVCRPVAAA